MSYRIIQAASAAELEQVVNQMIAEDWVPQGSLCLGRKEDGDGGLVDVYAQAMVFVPTK